MTPKRTQKSDFNVDLCFPRFFNSKIRLRAKVWDTLLHIVHTKLLWPAADSIIRDLIKRLIRSRIIESAAYCNQILMPLILPQNYKTIWVSWTVIVITVMLAQSDPVKRWTQYLQMAIKFSNWKLHLRFGRTVENIIFGNFKENN